MNTVLGTGRFPRGEGFLAQRASVNANPTLAVGHLVAIGVLRQRQARIQPRAGTRTPPASQEHVWRTTSSAVPWQGPDAAKLDQLDAVAKLDDLRVPPGNRLHALTGDLRGWLAVRVNDQYRIVFKFVGTDAVDVRCIDYH